MTTGIPSKRTMSLRRLEEREEPETLGTVADLARFCGLKCCCGKGRCSRLRVDLDRLCLTPAAEFWVELEGRFALEVEGIVLVIAGANAGEARIGVNGVKLNGAVLRAPRMTSSLLSVWASGRLRVEWSESNCNREAERLSRSAGGAGSERTSVVIPRAR